MKTAGFSRSGRSGLTLPFWLIALVVSAALVYVLGLFLYIRAGEWSDLWRSRRAGAVVYDVRVVNRYPHDPGAFTQGLFFHAGALYESTGIKGSSTLRRVELETGRVLQQVSLESFDFGEGATAFGNTAFQLTWKGGLGYLFELPSLRHLGRFPIPAAEGWGLACDGKHLILSDGSDRLTVFDREKFTAVSSIQVHEAGIPVRNLNELEYFHGEILANVWKQPRIARIDPLSGRVFGWLDLSGVTALGTPSSAGPDHVLNGIAYEPCSGRLFVTGKCWPWLFEIRIDSAR